MSRQNSSLRTRLTRSLVGIGLLSVLVLAAINFVAARSLLDDSIDGQLVSLRNARVEALEGGFQRLEQEVSLIARDPSVAEALVEMSAGYGEIQDDITPEDVALLESIYEEEALAAYDEAGVERPDAADLLPESVPGRYVQNQYIARNPLPADERGLLDDAGDGSTYSEAHARYAPFLREVTADSGVGDLLLVSADNLDVVYSTKKRIDLGTDVDTGPFADSGLRDVLNALSRETAGQAVAADTVFYMPDASSPLIFVAAAVRDGSEVVGAVIAELPTELVTEVTTAGQEWDLLGLGETGETYVVGRDGTLRTDSRLWLEDPDEYLRRFLDQDYDPRLAELIESVGSPVLIQDVDNEAVTSAQDGDEFIGSVTSYLGDTTNTASAPVDVAGLDWIVIAEQAESETDDALGAFIRRILLLLAVLLPAIAVVGWLLARALVLPVEPLVAASARIADGDLDTEVGDLGRNEFGDLGRRLDGVASTLRDQKKALIDEEGRINEMLRAVLPARLVDRVRGGERRIADMLDTATVVSLTLVGLPDPMGPDADLFTELTGDLAERVDELLDRYGVDRARASTDHQIFLAGLGDADPDYATAARFASAVLITIESAGADLGVEITARLGLAGGEVATGVLGVDQVAFGVWGDPPGRALTLDSVARRGEILVDRSVAEGLGQAWPLEPSGQAVGLADDTIEAFVLDPRNLPAETVAAGPASG